MRRAGRPWLAALVLLPVVAVFAYPFAWMVTRSFEGRAKAVHEPLRLWPDEASVAAWRGLGQTDPSLWGALFNSCVVALCQAALATAVTALAGYAFARARGRIWAVPALFVALLPILVPRQLLAQPASMWIVDLGLFDSLLGVVLPGAVSGLGVLFFLQMFRQVPESLHEAAVVEGASEWGVFRAIAPMLGGALVTYGLIHFVLAWHEHLLPLLVLHSPERKTLPLALSSFNDMTNHVPKSILFAASTCAVAPVALLFALGYRRFRGTMSDLVGT